MNITLPFALTRRVVTAPIPRQPQPRALLVDGQMRTVAELRSNWAGGYGMTRGADTGDYSETDAAAAYKRGTTVFITVNARCSFSAEIPIRCIDSASGKPIANSPAQAFIDNAPRYIWRALASYLIWGKVYFLKHRNASRYPTRLEWLNPLDVTEDVDYATQTVKGYRVRRGGAELTVKPCDMIADYTFNPTDDLDGLSAVEVALVRSNIEMNIGRFGAAFFANSARPDGLLTFEGDLPKEDQEKARNYWQSIFKGAANAFKTAIMGGGKWLWTPVNAAPVDLAMTELTTQADMKICAIMQVNPALVGIGTAADPLSAQSTYDAVRRQHIQFVAIPDVRKLCNVLNEQWLHRDFDGAPEQWTLEPDVAGITSDALGTGERATTAGAAVTAHVWSVNEGRKYTGKEPLVGHIDRAPDWALSVYNAGVITRNETRVAIGFQPITPTIPDGFIFDIDPRQKAPPAPASPFGLSNYPPLLQNAPTPLLEAKAGHPAAVATPAETVTVEAVPPKRSADTAAQLYELSLWRNKVKKHDWSVSFHAELLPTEIVSFVRTALDERWQPALVFDSAKDAIRAGVQPTPLGADAAEAETYWREYDNLKADLGAAWATYQRAVAEHVTPDGVPDRAFEQNRETLLADWVGTQDAPGILTKLIIAGEAAGDVMLQRSKAIKPGNTRALSVGVNWSLVSQQALDFARTYGFDLIRGIDATTRNEVSAVIQRGISAGMSRDDIAAALREAVSLDRIATRATAIAQTEAVRAYNEGSFNRWTQAGVSEAEWQTVRDSHVCPRCNSVHGTRARISEGWRSAVDGETLRPPRHPNCRCFTRPVLNAAAEVVTPIAPKPAAERPIAFTKAVTPTKYGSMTSYSIADIPDSNLDVIYRESDGKRVISTVYIPAEYQGKGLGQKLYLQALQDGPVVAKQPGDDNFSKAAQRVHETLVKKGWAEIVDDEYGAKLLQITDAGRKVAAQTGTII